MKINLGCGIDIRDEYINVDRFITDGVNIVCDFERWLPFKDNSFDYLYSRYVLEHIDDIVKIMSEIHRILKPNGIAHIEVPHCSWFQSYASFDHKHFFTSNSFDCFRESSKEGYFLDIKFKFNIVKKKLSWGEGYKYKMIDNLINSIINRMPNFYERFLLWVIPINKIIFEMKVIKGE